ncbi:phosphotransferase family protein [Paenibacillus contaminans]|uniref:Aminoglycoside phosphotransferase family protein n=1 Tax=Paenibacillus contaminans TaxID=450362 RepID=A0A329LJP0_9BACL|nr:aminoglycoside phosphotransferase family protein [Paenibacillus contaminans]RAV08181.1 aminoglycoside phosphotransferase family protein [Paenibacillus contaminans]
MRNIETVISNLKLDVSAIKDVPESYSSEVYKLELADGEIVYAKIPYNRDKLYREYRILEKLQQVLPVPKVLELWPGDESISGALLLSAIQGEPCSGEMDEKLAYEIGVCHAKLHEVTMPGYGYEVQDGFRFLERNDWRLHIRNNFEKWKKPCQEILEAGLFTRCVDYFDEAFHALPQQDGPCIVHMDFRPGNILLHDGKVAGIIDFESARGGSSEIDFTKVNHYIWEVYPHTRKPYIQGYESVRPIIDLDKVLPFYSFYDAFGAVVWCKNRGLDERRDFLQENIAVLEKSANR